MCKVNLILKTNVMNKDMKVVADSRISVAPKVPPLSSFILVLLSPKLQVLSQKKYLIFESVVLRCVTDRQNALIY